MNSMAVGGVEHALLNKKRSSAGMKLHVIIKTKHSLADLGSIYAGRLWTPFCNGCYQHVHSTIGKGLCCAQQLVIYPWMCTSQAQVLGTCTGHFSSPRSVYPQSVCGTCSEGSVDSQPAVRQAL
jgi:hypothetical protein